MKYFFTMSLADPGEEDCSQSTTIRLVDIPYLWPILRYHVSPDAVWEPRAGDDF
jgi:hypothetical protein